MVLGLHAIVRIAECRQTLYSFLFFKFTIHGKDVYRIYYRAKMFSCRFPTDLMNKGVPKGGVQILRTR